jgi:hypothetical protein
MLHINIKANYRPWDDGGEAAYVSVFAPKAHEEFFQTLQIL